MHRFGLGLGLGQRDGSDADVGDVVSADCRRGDRSLSEQVDAHDGGGLAHAGLVALVRRGQEPVDVLGDDDRAPHVLPAVVHRRLVKEARGPSFADVTRSPSAGLSYPASAWVVLMEER